MVPTTRMVTMARTVTIAITNLPLADKLERVWFFQKTCYCLTLAWFFTFRNADIRFEGRELVWMTYTAADDQAGGTFRSKKTCGCGPKGLWSSLVMHMTAIRGLVSKAKNDDPRRVFRLYQYLFSGLCGRATRAHRPDLLSCPPVVRYGLSTRWAVTFNCMPEVSLTWWWRTGICCL